MNGLYSAKGLVLVLGLVLSLGLALKRTAKPIRLGLVSISVLSRFYSTKPTRQFSHTGTTQGIIMAFRIECPNCQSKAVISNSNNIAKDIELVFMKNLYCRCTNIKDCGCTFVVSVSFSHYLSPPQRYVVEMAREIIRQQDQLKLGGVNIEYEDWFTF